MIALVVNFVMSRVFQRYFAADSSATTSLLQVWLRALYRPVQVFVWVITLFYVLQISGVNLLALQVNQASSLSLESIEKVLAVAFILWIGLRFINQFERYVRSSGVYKKWRLDKTTLHALTQLIRMIVIVVCVLMMMQTAGISISSLLAFGGISGIAVGFAAKDTLANFLGSMMIYIDRPFKVGDWIRSPDRNIEGTVEHIGWRLTRIRTFDKRPLYVPNSLFSTISVENPSRMTNRRIKQTIGLRYDDAPKVAVILADIEAMLKNHPEIDTKQTLMVNFQTFAESSLNFFIYTFTKTTNWVKFQAVQQDVLLKVIDIITKHGAECAFPTQTLYLNNQPGDTDD